MDLDAILGHEDSKISWGTGSQTPLVLRIYELMHANWHAHIHVTPLLKILAMGLKRLYTLQLEKAKAYTVEFLVDNIHSKDYETTY